MSSMHTALPVEALPGEDFAIMEMKEMDNCGSETSQLLRTEDNHQSQAKEKWTTPDQSRTTTPDHLRSNSSFDLRQTTLAHQLSNGSVGPMSTTAPTAVIEVDEHEWLFICLTRETCDLILESKDDQEKVVKLVHSYISRVDNFEDNIQKHVSEITPLHRTVENNCYLATEILLEQKHFTCVKNQSGETPLDVALRLKHDDIAALIIRHMKKDETTHQMVIDKFKTKGKLRDYLNGDFEKTVMAVLDHMVSVNKDGGHHVRYDILDADVFGRTPDDTNFNINCKTPYQIIAKSRNEYIVNHPVVRALTKYKWENVARFLFWLLTTMYMFTLFTLTFSAVVSVKSQPMMPLSNSDALQQQQPLTPLNNSNVSKQEQMTPVGAELVNTYSHSLDIARGVFEVVTCVLICMRLFIHILEMCREKLDYLKDKFNVIELVSILLLLAVIPVRLTHPAASWYIFSIGYFFWVLLIFKYSVVFRQTGAYAQILFGILVKDLTQFGLLFAIITLAFSGTFLLALKADGNLETHNETSSFWGILFVGVRTLTDGPVVEYTEFNNFSCIIMLVFLFVALVILLNLLIAQMTDTYNKVQSVADRHLEKNIALICANMECFGMPCFDKKAKRKETYIACEPIHDFALLEASPEEEIRNDIQYVKRRHLMSQTHMQTIKASVKEELNILSTISKANEVNTNTIIDNIDTFSRQVQDCSSNINELRSETMELTEMTSVIKAMIKQLLEWKLRPSNQEPATRYLQTSDRTVIDEMRCEAHQMRQLKEPLIRRSWEQSQFAERIQTNLGDAIKEREEHEVLSLLSTYLEDNKNVNLLVDLDGSSPLHYAAEVGYFYVVKKLLQHDANPMKETKDNKIPLQFALENGHDDVAALIINNMDNESIRAFFSKHASLLNGMIRQDAKFEKSLTAILDSMLEREHTGAATVHYGLLEADKDGHTPSDFNKFNPTDISPFNSLTSTGNQTLINHPVVRLLIRSKWEAFARTRFVYMAIFYLVSLFAFTFSIVTSVFADDVTSYSSCLDNARACFEVLTLMFAGGRLFIELVEWYKNGTKYFHDTFNYLELTSSILVLCVLPVRYSQPRTHWYLLAIAYLLWTLMIFKYAACFKQTGAYAQILWQILIGDVVQFGLLFAVVNLAFAGTFLLALKAEDGLQIHEETRTFWGVLYVGVRTLVESGPVVTYTGDGGYGVFSTIIKIVFIFFTVVILLNILIAQLNDTYQKIQAKASLHLEANIARIITRMENNDWNFLCGFFCRQPSRIMYYKEKERIGNLPETLDMKSGISDMSDDLQHIADTQITTQLSVNTVIRKVGQVKEEIPKVVESNDKLYDKVKSDVKRVEEQVTEMGNSYNVGVKEEIVTMARALITLMDEVREYMRSSEENGPYPLTQVLKEYDVSEPYQDITLL